MMTPFGYFFIGEYHEFLDELMCIISFSFFDSERSFCSCTNGILMSKIKIDLSRFECYLTFFASAFFEYMIE